MSDEFKAASKMFSDYRYPQPLSIEPVPGARFPARWDWKVNPSNGKVHMSIEDGIFGGDDKNSKLKSVELNYAQRKSLLNRLKAAATNDIFENSVLEIKSDFFNGQKLDHFKVIAVLTVVRGKSGEIRVKYKRHTYEQVFLMRSNTICIKTQNENKEWVEDVGLSSKAYTLAFVEFSDKFLDIEEWNRYVVPKKKSSSNNNSYNRYDDSDDLDFN